MTLSIIQSATAVGPNSPASFNGTGGTEPYTYAVTTVNPGGSIDSATGLYYAPSAASSDPKYAYDTIRVTDYVGATATATILVGTPLLLFCEILQRELGLASGRVYLWDQKIFQPQDNGLYIAVSVPTCKPFANVNRTTSDGSGMQQGAYVCMMATVDIDIISRGPSARDRTEEVILALNSIYAQQQQEANSFFIGKLPPNSRFINLSYLDGAAIPYRFKISIQMQYAYSKDAVAPYFDDFEQPDLIVND